MIIDDFNIDSFQLISGAPITVPGLELRIYQPKLYEIASIGEENFYRFLSFFKIDKETVSKNIEDKDHLEIINQKTNYEILKMIMQNEPEVEFGVYTIFSLVIKEIESVKFNDFFIIIKTQSGHQYVINDEYFSIIKEILYKIFNLQDAVEGYNPANSIASEIAKKLEERKKRLAALQGKKNQSVFTDFVSILAIGLGCVEVSKILNLTVYQIFNLMKRFGMYNQYNIQIQAMLQGAEDIELVDWLQKI